MQFIDAGRTVTGSRAAAPLAAARITTALPQPTERKIVLCSFSTSAITHGRRRKRPSRAAAGRERQQQRRRAMADGGAHKRPLDDPEDANGGALVAVKKARQEDSLVVASKRPEIKAVSC